MRVLPILDATSPDVTVGRHSIWVPLHGIKVPFQWGGLVTKYGHREAGYNPAEVIPHELAILRALAANGMAPPVGDLVYIETLISNHPGGWHADPCGAWGYEMADARALSPGRFSVEAMRRLPIEGSVGAWRDIEVAGRDNVVNSYLVDVARSRFDALRWTGPGLEALPPAPRESSRFVRAELAQHAQFPPYQREAAYQDFYFDGRWERGERRVVERATALGFAPRAGETVLEVGCQAGGFLQLAALAGAEAVGVEVSAAYVGCGRMLARHAQQNICIRELNAVARRDELLAWVRARFLNGVDHLLLLSMEKHIDIWPLCDAIGARRTYIETNAVSDRNPWKLRAEVETRGGRHVGDSTDRNLRRLYLIEKGRRS